MGRGVLVRSESSREPLRLSGVSEGSFFSFSVVKGELAVTDICTSGVESLVEGACELGE